MTARPRIDPSRLRDRGAAVKALFLGRTAETAAPAVSEAAPRSSTPRFHLPFDEKKPVLICGAPGTGKTTLARHLVENEPTSRPVTVIDCKDEPYAVPGKSVSVLGPHEYRTDADFFFAAARAVREAIQQSGLLVLDGLDLLTADYSEPIPAQIDFRAALEVALRSMRTRGCRVIAVSQAVPDASLRALCGVQILLGVPAPADWPLLFGHHPLPAEVEPFTGSLVLDGQISPVTFPDVPPLREPETEPEEPRHHRR